MGAAVQRLPGWLRPRLGLSEGRPVRMLLREHGLATVCEEARCPNKAECFSRPTAAFMILGRECTRSCGFCAVSPGVPGPPDPEEPMRVADAAGRMGLDYVVITSVTRDDLPDGGASQFASTVRAVRERVPGAGIEVLTPDFMGDSDALEVVLKSSPDVFNHNLETVSSLYPSVRPDADYRRSLELLRASGEMSPGLKTKSGLMLGFGEKVTEVEAVLSDLRTAGCDFVTIGQYLRPGRDNLPVREYVRPECSRVSGRPHLRWVLFTLRHRH
jgi:lipoic acid synthetase